MADIRLCMQHPAPNDDTPSVRAYFVAHGRVDPQGADPGKITGRLMIWDSVAGRLIPAPVGPKQKITFHQGKSGLWMLHFENVLAGIYVLEVSGAKCAAKYDPIRVPIWVNDSLFKGIISWPPSGNSSTNPTQLCDTFVTYGTSAYSVAPTGALVNGAGANGTPVTNGPNWSVEFDAVGASSWSAMNIICGSDNGTAQYLQTNPTNCRHH